MEINLSIDKTNSLLLELQAEYKYDCTYWIPLKNTSMKHKYLFLPSDNILSYQRQIEQFIKLNESKFYLTGEIGYIEPSKCWMQEVDDINLEYGPIEFFYFGKKLDWCIYISHESTITFCGDDLITFIKKLLGDSNLQSRLPDDIDSRLFEVSG